MPRVRHADTPLARYITGPLGMNQTEFARAIGRHGTTVNRWLSGTIEGMDPVIAALILVTRRLTTESRAAVWAELPNVPPESVALYRFMVAIDLVPRGDRSEIRALVAAGDISARLKCELSSTE